MDDFVGALVWYVAFVLSTTLHEASHALAAKLGGIEGRPTVMGVRPESLSDRNDGPFAGADNSIRVKVSVVEPLGDKMDVYVSTDAHEHIICRVDSHSRIGEGQDLSLYLDMERVHVMG